MRRRNLYKVIEFHFDSKLHAESHILISFNLLKLRPNIAKIFYVEEFASMATNVTVIILILSMIRIIPQYIELLMVNVFPVKMTSVHVKF